MNVTKAIAKSFCQKIIHHREIPNYKKLVCQVDTNKSGPLSKFQLEKFNEDGFLKIENILSESIIKGAQQNIDDLIDDLANSLHKHGKISNTYKGYDWTKRIIKIEEQWEGATGLINKHKILPRGFIDIYESKEILDIMVQLGLGPTIAAHPVWNLRTKMPKVSKGSHSLIPWHQDNSFWPSDTWHEKIIAAWIPLVDCNKVNGCMEFIKGGHKTGKTARHTVGGSTVGEDSSWYTELSEKTIEQDLLEKGKSVQEATEVVPANKGDIIIF